MSYSEEARRAPLRASLGHRAALLVIVCSLVGLIAGCSPAASRAPEHRPLGDDTTAFVVDGQAVPVREFRIFLREQRSSILSGASAPTGDANTAILDAARDEAIRTVVQFELAQRTGLIPDASYRAFLAGLAAENKRRADAIAAHEPIYGPTEYREADYLGYLLGQFRFEAPPLLVQSGQLDADEASLSAWVGAHGSLFLDDQGKPRQPNADEARLAYLDAGYEALVARLAGTSRVTATGVEKVIAASGCAYSGTC